MRVRITMLSSSLKEIRHPTPNSQNHIIYKDNAKQEIHINLKLLDCPDNEDSVSSLTRCFYN